MKNHTCHLDHHQRSHHVTIGPKNWARKLFNNQKGKLFNSQKEKLLDKQNSSNQPNQFQPIPSPNCDRSGQPDITQDVIVVQINEKRPVLKRSMLILLTKNSVLQIEQGDLLKQEIQARSSEDSKSLNVEQTLDRSGQPDKHIVALQDDPEIYHEIKTLNTDNETIRERIEEDMDFKIPGLPHSSGKQAHSASVRELIQKIEHHPYRHALEQDLRQIQSFNPFSPESKQMIRDVWKHRIV